MKIEIEAVIEATNKWGHIPMVKVKINGKTKSMFGSVITTDKCPICDAKLKE
jgi:hypothetical protein